jgi:hypothetical protein
MPQNRGFAVETRVLSRTYTGDDTSAGLVLGFAPTDANTIDDITYGAHGDNAGFQLEGPSLGSGVTYGGSGSVGYLRIRRHPDGVFDFERSSDGVSWTTDASHDFSSKTLLYVGLFSKCWNTHDPVVEFDYLDISIDQIPGTMLIVQ